VAHVVPTLHNNIKRQAGLPSSAAAEDAAAARVLGVMAADGLLAAVGSGSGSQSQSQSGIEQPQTPALQLQSVSQQMLQLATADADAVRKAGLNSSSSSSMFGMLQSPPPGGPCPDPDDSAVSPRAAAWRGWAPSKLQPQRLSATQQLAHVGLAQLQEVTEASQQLWPFFTSVHNAAIDCKQKLMDLDAFFRHNPTYCDAAALYELVEANQVLKAEKYAQEQQLNAALSALRLHTQTSTDTRVRQLQQALQQLQQQLHSRDAALASAEESNRSLRQQLAMPSTGAGSHQHEGAEDPVLGGAMGSRTAGRGQVAEHRADVIARQLSYDLQHAEDTASGVGNSRHGAAGSAAVVGDYTSSSSAGRLDAAAAAKQQQQQQLNQFAADIHQLKASFKAALAAKQQEVAELQQQLACVAEQASSTAVTAQESYTGRHHLSHAEVVATEP
jgi:uncharacterized protein YlxW (UPF0749 family)